MDALIFAQTLFYFAFSFLLIMFLVWTVFIGYYLMHIAKNLNKLSDNLNQASEEVKENVREIMERLSSLPFLSFFIKKHGVRTVSKKRSQ